MLQKTYRLMEVAKIYGDATDIEKIFLDKIILCLAQDEDQFIVTDVDFDWLLSEGKMPIHEVVQAYECINDELCFIFTMKLETFTSEDWHITCTMLRRIYNNLNMEM